MKVRVATQVLRVLGTSTIGLMLLVPMCTGQAFHTSTWQTGATI